MAIVLLVTATLVVVCVAFHLGVLQLISWTLPRLRLKRRLGVGVIILGAILGHLIEIWMFTVGLVILDRAGNYGRLVGQIQGGWFDHFYFSAVTYTSLGFGDIIVEGPLRLLTAMEVLTGLVLIAWTASFTFVAMQRFWGKD
jgi:hypothetical protein